MLSPSVLVKQAEHFVRSNSPAILAGLGVSGVVATTYLTAKAAYEIGYRDGIDENAGVHKSRKVFIKTYWRQCVAPVAAGVATVGCVIGATRAANRRTAAMTAAYSLSERALVEYKEKVTEKLGERKEQGIRDEVAKDKTQKALAGREVILVGHGSVPCVELHTGRVFLADMETLRKAEVEINDRLIRCDYASLAEFHTQIGISPTQSAGDFGWTHERGLLKLEFTYDAVEDRPCIAFGYNYLQAL